MLSRLSLLRRVADSAQIGSIAVTCSELPCRKGVSSATSSSRLEDICHLDELKHKTADEISAIWTEYHKDESKSRIATVLPTEDYKTYAARAGASPMFVLPLNKGEGTFSNLVLQAQLPHVFFTDLESYKRQPTDAPIQFSLTHYTELQGDKGIVLVRGDILDPASISVPEARTLTVWAHLFWTDADAYKHVLAFNHKQDEFNYNQLCAELGLRPQM